MLDVDAQNFSEHQAHEWFESYLTEENSDFPGNTKLRSLFQFWTGWTVVPFGGLTKKLKVAFLPDDDTKTLPTASACLAIIRLPTVYTSKKRFFEAMDIVLRFGRVGFPILKEHF